MLRDIYVATDFAPTNADPTVAAADKLRIIAEAPVTLTPWTIRGQVHDRHFSVSLPFVRGGDFMAGLPSMRDTLFMDSLNVGDPELYGHGIGSTLLRAACRYGVEREPRINRLAAGWTRLGLVNTAIRVLGEENVGVQISGRQYGWNGERPLEAVFDDFPPQTGEPYLVSSMQARIDPNLAKNWEAPIKQQ